LILARSCRAREERKEGRNTQRKAVERDIESESEAGTANCEGTGGEKKKKQRWSSSLSIFSPPFDRDSP
jgi:hypothetical protein